MNSPCARTQSTESVQFIMFNQRLDCLEYGVRYTRAPYPYSSVQQKRDGNFNEKNECGASTVGHGERRACRLHVQCKQYVLHAACTSSGIWMNVRIIILIILLSFSFQSRTSISHSWQCTSRCSYYSRPLSGSLFTCNQFLASYSERNVCARLNQNARGIWMRDESLLDIARFHGNGASTSI